MIFKKAIFIEENIGIYGKAGSFFVRSLGDLCVLQQRVHKINTVSRYIIKEDL